MALRKIATTLLLSLGLAAGISGCDFEEYKRQRIEEEARRTEQRKTQIVAMYNSSEGIARFTIPQIEITAKKTNYTVNPITHLGNALKVQHMIFPVSESYFNSVRENQSLDSKFNWTGLFTSFKIEDYEIFISKKFHSEINCLIKNNSCQEIDGQTYFELANLNNSKSEYKSLGNNSVMIREGKKSIDDLFNQTCDITIESQKTNYTLSIFKHLANHFNKMDYPVEFPRFMCDKLSKGYVIDRNFVGASILFSRSMSDVTYKVKSIQRNY